MQEERSEGREDATTSGGTGALPIATPSIVCTEDLLQDPLNGRSVAQAKIRAGGKASSALTGTGQQRSGSDDAAQFPHPLPKRTEGLPQAPAAGSTGLETVSQTARKGSSISRGKLQPLANAHTAMLSTLEAVPVRSLTTGAVGSPTAHTPALGGESSRPRVETRCKTRSTGIVQAPPAGGHERGGPSSVKSGGNIPSKATTQPTSRDSAQIPPAGQRSQGQTLGARQIQSSGAGHRKRSGAAQGQASNVGQRQQASTLSGQPLSISRGQTLDTGQASTSSVGGSRAGGLSTSSPDTHVMSIGIETEFLLATIVPYFGQERLSNFAATLAANYNINVPQQHPRMRPTLRPYDYDGEYNEWGLVDDDTMSTGCCPWGIELVSPILKAFPGSTWRQDVLAAWNFLQQRYHVMGTTYCSTHIHVSIEPEYTLSDLKRIAQAVIHFETAIEALMPPSRRGNKYAKSNWLDAPGLGQLMKTRRRSILAIEHVIDARHLRELMQPVRIGRNRSYAWSFYNLFNKKGTIEFRKPPVSLTPYEALSWAEFVISFIHASVRCEFSKLVKVPSTVGGLRWFLQQFQVPDMHDNAHLNRLWQGKDPNEAVEPIPQPWGSLLHVQRMKARLGRMAEADLRDIQAFASTARMPYW